MNWKLFGREPTLWVAVLASAVMLLGAFNLGLTGEQAALWAILPNALLGAINALLVRPVPPVAFTYLVTTLVGIAGAYGLNFTDIQVAIVQTVVLNIVGLIVRGQVAPQPSALTKA